MIYIFVRVVKLLLIFECKIDLGLYAGPESLGFRVSIELRFVLVWVDETDLISLLGIELDFISVWGSELNVF